MNEKPPYDAPPGADADSGAEPEPTAEELARAASLARLVDRMSAGEPPPPAMPAEDRLLLDAAAMIHAAHQPRPLPARKVNELVAAALAQPEAEPRRISRRVGPDKTEPGFAGPVLIPFPGGARREAATTTALGDSDASAAPERSSASGIDLRPRSTRLRVMVGTVVLAMAAALALWVWSARQNRLGTGRPGGAGLATGSGLGQKLRSRSAGSLLGGPIASAESGNARARMDLVFADRLSGYREVVFRGRARRGVATGVSP